MNKRDEEVALDRSSIGVAQDDDGDHSLRAFRSKFPSKYSTLFDLLELISIPAGWILRFVYNIIRQLSPRVQRLEGKKKNHTETMHLIEYLAKEGYFDFFVRGKDPSQQSILGPQDSPPETGEEGDAQKKALSPSSEDRWNEPPLFLGAQMGLNDFVGKILQVCPQSATYLDTKGRNVLQVAIESGNRETVETIRRMAQGDNPILPSWLLSSIDSKTRNTILHLATDGTCDVAKEEQDEPDAMQLHYDLVWFEMLESSIPKELVFSRNTQGKTAQELFTSSHKQTRKSCKKQLVRIANTSTSAVAAVVFALSSSFSHTDDPKTSDSPMFKALSYTYVIGLSLAATSLFFFLSLVKSSYKEQEFRSAIPTKFYLAGLTYNMALGTLLLAFTFNTFVQIYGVEGVKEKQAITFMLEIIACPLLACLIFFPDAVFGIFRPYI
ncbi:uncharacterized protein LOC135631295 [Musa acuminata AAA Group]|uniref:uncharacterized protein LOC135631295 n=1 Tax=Musa acuminata AAA Group TaxID=214697 RepID=UPI0031D9D326